jgi:hypothetical protein
LRSSRKRGMRRSKPSAAELAEAVNAADDMAGSPALELDLSSLDAWSTLGLDQKGRHQTR